MRLLTTLYAIGGMLAAVASGSLGMAVETKSTKVNAEKLKEYNIIPEKISSEPPMAVTVTYGQHSVDFGNELTPTITQTEPKLSWSAENKTYYSVLFIDPDVKSTFNQYSHWLVVDIPGNDVTAGRTIFQYRGSAPQQGQGLHRYVFLVYKQSSPLKLEALDRIKDEKITDRGAFDIKTFVEENQLEGPIAVNFYRAQYDDLVPIIYEQILAFYTPKSADSAVHRQQ